MPIASLRTAAPGLRRPFVNAEGLAGVAHDDVIEVIPFPKERIHS